MPDPDFPDEIPIIKEPHRTASGQVSPPLRLLPGQQMAVTAEGGTVTVEYARGTGPWTSWPPGTVDDTVTSLFIALDTLVARITCPDGVTAVTVVSQLTPADFPLPYLPNPHAHLTDPGAIPTTGDNDVDDALQVLLDSHLAVLDILETQGLMEPA
jgi:hypothetical protein